MQWLWCQHLAAGCGTRAVCGPGSPGPRVLGCDQHCWWPAVPGSSRCPWVPFPPPALGPPCLSPQGRLDSSAATHLARLDPRPSQRRPSVTWCPMPPGLALTLHRPVWPRALILLVSSAGLLAREAEPWPGLLPLSQPVPWGARLADHSRYLPPWGPGLGRCERRHTGPWSLGRGRAGGVARAVSCCPDRVPPFSRASWPTPGPGCGWGLQEGVVLGRHSPSPGPCASPELAACPFRLLPVALPPSAALGTHMQVQPGPSLLPGWG